MASNLPPGVTLSMIPGNRPEDVRHEQVMEAAWEELPYRFAEALEIMRKIDTTDDAEELSSAANDLVNLFEPTKSELDSAHNRGVEPDRRWVFDNFLNAMEEVSRLAGEYMDPPEREYEADYDMGDL